MLFFALGLGTLVALLWTADAFSRASIGGLKRFSAWAAALAGLLLVAMLLLTGRGGLALTGLVLLGPLAWSWWRDSAGQPGTDRDAASGTRPRQPAAKRMTEAEARQVLGLPPGASESQIREAWIRLMQAAHPDHGGSDWLAARVNEARDVLLHRR